GLGIGHKVFWEAQARGGDAACQGRDADSKQSEGNPPWPSHQQNLNLEKMELFWWILTLVLMAIGLLGTVLPILPGPALIFGAAVIHRLMLGPEKGLGWPGLLVLLLLCLTTIAIDFLGGWLGARRFGATRWGTCGAIIGALIG